MPVAVEMNFRGATLDQYDQVIEKMGLTPGGSGPSGAISHWVAKTDDGIRVVDVWETREVFDRFAKEQIGPYPRGDRADECGADGGGTRACRREVAYVGRDGTETLQERTEGGYGCPITTIHNIWPSCSSTSSGEGRRDSAGESSSLSRPVPRG